MKAAVAMSFLQDEDASQSANSFVTDLRGFVTITGMGRGAKHYVSLCFTNLPDTLSGKCMGAVISNRRVAAAA